MTKEILAEAYKIQGCAGMSTCERYAERYRDSVRTKSLPRKGRAIRTYELLTRVSVIRENKISCRGETAATEDRRLFVVLVCCVSWWNNRRISVERTCLFQFNLGLPRQQRRAVLPVGDRLDRVCARHFSRYKVTLEEIGNASRVGDCFPTPRKRAGRMQRSRFPL